MSYFKIDGTSYDVLVVSVVEDFNILYSENTGRTMSSKARMSLDPIGTFYGHTVVVKRKPGYERQYDALFDYISQPRETGMNVEIVHNQETISYEAYVSSGSRELKKIDPKTGKVYWSEMEIKITPMEAYIT